MATDEQGTSTTGSSIGEPAHPDAMRWKAVLQPDSAEGCAFVYAVVTTGVYCHPGCSSRLPKRENVRFFDSAEEAERAGFRPCKRCRPDIVGAKPEHLEAIVEACRELERADSPPSLPDLARRAALSPSHFSRLFKSIVGITPKQYAIESRLDRMRSRLSRDATVTEAAYNSGFNSGSRFYDTAKSALGMKPTEYRNGGRGRRIRYGIAQCCLGWVLIAATAKGICAILFGDSPEDLPEELRARFPEAELARGEPEYETLLSEAVRRVESPATRFDLPLDIQGTAFQRRVWEALMQIPPGTTTSYAEIARRIDHPKAARAVAQACAANKIAVAIPCHRVRRSDGGLGGYRWGVRRKQALLEREQEATRC